MEQVQIIRENFPEEITDVTEFRGQTSLTVRRDSILKIGRFLHDDPRLAYTYLQDLCGVDYLGKKDTRFEVVYHLYSLKNRSMLRLKAPVPENDCRIDSVISIWRGVDWHEREAFDMFGIVFVGHPDLRRILMPEDWEGHPLRKDYPVKGPEKEWSGFLDVLDRAKRFSEYDWHG